MCYNIHYNINNNGFMTLVGIILDAGAVPAASTKNTLAYVRIKTVSGTIRSQCVFDGGEIGSTDVES